MVLSTMLPLVAGRFGSVDCRCRLHMCRTMRRRAQLFMPSPGSLPAPPPHVSALSCPHGISPLPHCPPCFAPPLPLRVCPCSLAPTSTRHTNAGLKLQQQDKGAGLVSNDPAGKHPGTARCARCGCCRLWVFAGDSQGMLQSAGATMTCLASCVYVLISGIFSGELCHSPLWFLTAPPRHRRRRSLCRLQRRRCACPGRPGPRHRRGHRAGPEGHR